jgi:hypothetical protein
VRTGRSCSEDTKCKIGDGNRGKKRSPEQVEILRTLRVGLPSPMKGMHHTEEVREKISKAKKGKPWSEARRKAQDMRGQESAASRI